jgi:hypothetical protein
MCYYCCALPDNNTYFSLLPSTGAAKLKILLTGQWTTGKGRVINVLDDGKSWEPGQRRTKNKYRNNVRRFERIWGTTIKAEDQNEL